MNLPQGVIDFKGKLRKFWQKLAGQDNFFNELGVGLIVCLIAIGVLIVILVKPNEIKQLTDRFASKPVVQVAPTPTPIPLPKGPREFGVSGGDNPQFSELKISEYDPSIGQSQTITVSLTDKKGDVTAVELTLLTDKKVKTYPMKLFSGTTKKGNWSVIIDTEDKHDYRYRLILNAKNNKGESSTVNPIFK
jgi:hypothetical protein